VSDIIQVYNPTMTPTPRRIGYPVNPSTGQRGADIFQHSDGRFGPLSNPTHRNLPDYEESLPEGWEFRYDVDRSEVSPRPRWESLRKGATDLSIEYASTFTNNLSAHNVRVRAEPSIEISIDLNPNLRASDKFGNRYCDARELADGEVTKLKSVQISDDLIIGKLRTFEKLAYSTADIWSLAIELEGRHSFKVRRRWDDTVETLVLMAVDVISTS
jgi:hypothetical protein